MNWEKKLNGTSFLSLKNKDGETHHYIKLSDAKGLGELAFNEALERIKEIYKDDYDIVKSVEELKIR